MRLEDKSCSELNLARTADGTEHTPRIIGKVASRILKYGIPISSLRERILGIAWDNEVRMIQKIERFCAKSNFLAFAQLKALPECQIQLCEGRTTQHISTSIAKLVGGRHCKCIRIEPARWCAHSAAVWTRADVGITNQVRPLGH